MAHKLTCWASISFFIASVARGATTSGFSSVTRSLQVTGSNSGDSFGRRVVILPFSVVLSDLSESLYRDDLNALHQVMQSVVTRKIVENANTFPEGTTLGYVLLGDIKSERISETETNVLLGPGVVSFESGDVLPPREQVNTWVEEAMDDLLVEALDTTRFSTVESSHYEPIYSGGPDFGGDRPDEGDVPVGGVGGDGEPPVDGGEGDAADSADDSSADAGGSSDGSDSDTADADGDNADSGSSPAGAEPAESPAEEPQSDNNGAVAGGDPTDAPPVDNGAAEPPEDREGASAASTKNVQAKDGGLPVPVIVGAVCGGLALTAVIVTAVYALRRNQRRKPRHRHSLDYMEQQNPEESNRRKQNGVSGGGGGGMEEEKKDEEGGGGSYRDNAGSGSSYFTTPTSQGRSLSPPNHSGPPPPVLSSSSSAQDAVLLPAHLMSSSSPRASVVSPSVSVSDDDKSRAGSESDFTVNTEAGDSAALKSLSAFQAGGGSGTHPNSGFRMSPGRMVHESFERERQVNIRKDMLTTAWSGRGNANGPAGAIINNESVLQPSHFSASQEKLVRRQAKAEDDSGQRPISVTPYNSSALGPMTQDPEVAAPNSSSLVFAQANNDQEDQNYVVHQPSRPSNAKEIV